MRLGPRVGGRGPDWRSWCGGWEHKLTPVGSDQVGEPCSTWAEVWLLHGPVLGAVSAPTCTVASPLTQQWESQNPTPSPEESHLHTYLRDSWGAEATAPPGQCLGWG